MPLESKFQSRLPMATFLRVTVVCLLLTLLVGCARFNYVLPDSPNALSRLTPISPPPKIALVLGSGGPRGYAGETRNCFKPIAALSAIDVLRLKITITRPKRNNMSDTSSQRTASTTETSASAQAQWPNESRHRATGPLAGVRVLDMTAVGMGPYCTQTLGDYGADVIKVESPEGDVFRHATPSNNKGMGAPFLQLNRNKQSLVLNLKEAQALSDLRQLAKSADVLVYNVRPQSMRKLGLGFEDLQAINQRLIYCGVYGFSESGPYAGRPAFDDIIQAMSGLADLQGRGRLEPPAYVTSIMADKITGLSALSAILAALYEREKSGLGQAIEVPMFETMVAFNLLEHMGGATFNQPGNNMAYARAVSPHRKPYRTADGYIGLLPYTSSQWQRFFEIAGRPEVMHDPKFATPEERAKHVGELYEMLESIVVKRSSAEWLALFEANDIPAAHANRLEDLQQDPHLVATEFFQTHDHPTEGQIVMAKTATTFSRTPASVRSLAPNLGEHNETILKMADKSGDK